MSGATSKTSATLLVNLSELLPDLGSVYKDIHAHPELSMQETRTAGIAAERLRAAGYDVLARRRTSSLMKRSSS